MKEPTVPARSPEENEKRSDGAASLIDLYAFVLLAVGGLSVWLAFTNPRLAVAIGFGVLIVTTLLVVVRRPG